MRLRLHLLLVLTAAAALASAACAPKRIPIASEPPSWSGEARETVRRMLVERGTPDVKVRRSSIEGTFGRVPARILLEMPVSELRGEWNFSPFSGRPFLTYDLDLTATSRDKTIKSVRVPFDNQKDARAFVRAFNELVAENRVLLDPGDFEAKAAAWRAANPKPALGEEANKHRVLAQNAMREGNVEAAFLHFHTAVWVDPTWSSGNFNLALLYAEIGDFAEAARYMKRFLLLEPDSKEAPLAKSKLIVWEEKATHGAY